MALFTVSELETLLGLSEPIGSDLAELLPGLVTDVVLEAAGVTEPFAGSGLKTLALTVAARVVVNPEGLTSESFAGFAQGYGRLPEGAVGVFLTDTERRLAAKLGALAGGRSGGFSVRVPVVYAMTED